jgi:hypothetical protein
MFPLILLAAVALAALAMSGKGKGGAGPGTGPVPTPGPGTGPVPTPGPTPVGPVPVGPGNQPIQMLSAGSTSTIQQGETYQLYLYSADYNPSPSDIASLGQMGYPDTFAGYMQAQLDAHFFPNGAGDGTIVAGPDTSSDPGYVSLQFQANVSGTVGGQMMSAFDLIDITGQTASTDGGGGVSPGGGTPVGGFGLFGGYPAAEGGGAIAPAPFYVPTSLRHGLAQVAGRGYVPPNRRHPPRGPRHAPAGPRHYTGAGGPSGPGPDWPAGRASHAGRFGAHDDELD